MSVLKGRPDHLPPYSCLDHIQSQNCTILGVPPLGNLSSLTGIDDKDKISEPASTLLKQLVAGAWADVSDADQLVELATETRQQRAESYV